MRVFVFGTGRCGSVAVSNAFRFATNFTVSHEAYCSLLHYPDSHVAVNPQMRIRMDEVVAHYPEAHYVWLKREMQDVVNSYECLDHGHWLHTWWSFYNTVIPNNRFRAAAITVRTFLAECERAFSQCPERWRRIWTIEQVKPPFESLWQEIGAEGDLAGALASFDVPCNTSEQRGDR